MTFDDYDILGAEEKNSKAVVFAVTDQDADGVYQFRDMTGRTLKASVRVGEDGNSSEAPDNLTVSFDNRKKGIVRAMLPKNHKLTAGTYWYSVRAVDPDNMEEVVARGKIEVAGSAFA